MSRAAVDETLDAPPRLPGSPTRTSALVTRLRRDLLTADLAPGQPLRLAVMRERYGTGLTPLREALFQLVAEGLVTVENQRGFRAAPVSPEALKDLTEQRVFLETQALRLSIEKGDLAWESRVLAAHHRLAGTPLLSPDGLSLSEEWAEVHRTFHRALVDECGSPWLLRFREILTDQSERYRRFSLRGDPDRDVAGEHHALAEAVLARDADAATARLSAHYWRTTSLCELAFPVRQ